MTQPGLPLEYVGDAPLLFGWSGTLWSQLYSDPEFLQRYYSGQALSSAQVRVALAEAAACLDRETVPARRRLRWQPVVLRRKDRGKGGSALVRFGDSAVFGPQPGTMDVFEFGPSGKFRDFFVYPVPLSADRISYAVDTLRGPASVLVAGRDFVVDRGTLAIRKEADPLDLHGAEESTLWVCDAEIPASYVGDHVSYVFGISDTEGEPERVLSASNALWDAVSGGLSPSALSSALGAIYGVPTVREDEEIIRDINTSGDHIVGVTNKTVYMLPLSAVMRPELRPGSVVRKGEFLDTAIQIYAGSRLQAPAAIPTLFLPAAMFIDPVRYGFNVSHDPVPVYSDGLDRNGNPKLWFHLDGTAEDLSTFWDGVWYRCEQAGVSLISCFAGAVDATIASTKGAVVGDIDALAFMLSNFVGANTVVVAVDTRQLEHPVRTRTMSRLISRLHDVVPAYARLFIVEHTSVPLDTYDLEDESSSALSELGVCSIASSRAQAGDPSRRFLTYKDSSVRTGWVPVCERVIR